MFYRVNLLEIIEFIILGARALLKILFWLYVGLRWTFRTASKLNKARKKKRLERQAAEMAISQKED